MGPDPSGGMENFEGKGAAHYVGTMCVGNAALLS